MGWKWSLAVVQPGPSHSNQRKMLRRAIGPQRVGSHDAYIESETAKLLTTFEKFEGDPNLTLQR
jgi:cytochrome P450